MLNGGHPKVIAYFILFMFDIHEYLINVYFNPINNYYWYRIHQVPHAYNLNIPNCVLILKAYNY
jgi:hypothetical protein